MELQEISEKIHTASRTGNPLRITGSGTKNFYGNELSGEVYSLREYSGMIDYNPSELILTAKAGTYIAELENILGLNGQMFPFEPPYFGESATLGGTVACGFSGPRRPFTGSARSFTLGIKVIDGSGKILSFGGRVMKNVAGYDISRLMAGSLGTLGVILEISMKVLPAPEAELTITREQNQNDAVEFFNNLAGRSLPLSGASWYRGISYLRLSGSGSSILASSKKIGGDKIVLHDLESAESGDEVSYWKQLKEQKLPFFTDKRPLWRVSVPPATPPEVTHIENADAIYDWLGAIRWIKSDEDPKTIRNTAEIHGGHATLFRTPGSTTASGKNFCFLSPEVLKLHKNLKNVFDPKGILNPGRMHPEF